LINNVEPSAGVALSSEPHETIPAFLVIRTPELALRELSTLGLPSKRDGSKIGHKGSGLKVPWCSSTGWPVTRPTA
jgi:hypothetical protein